MNSAETEAEMAAAAAAGGVPMAEAYADDTAASPHVDGAPLGEDYTGDDHLRAEDPGDYLRAGEAGASRRPQINLARLAVGTAVIASEQVREGARSVGGRAAAVLIGLAAQAKDRTEWARERLFEAIDDAERRGQDTIGARRHGATGIVDATIDDALAWAQVKVMPRFIDDLVPHLISDVVPRLIDGALPEIRDRVVPVIIGDLTTDARVQELILNQSRGILGQLADQLRTNTVRADDRLEAAAHRVVSRNDKGGPPSKESTKGLNEVRGV